MVVRLTNFEKQCVLESAFSDIMKIISNEQFMRVLILEKIQAYCLNVTKSQIR